MVRGTLVAPNASLTAHLSDRALDPDAGPIFGRRVLTMPLVLPMVHRGHLQDLDRFAMLLLKRAEAPR